MVIAAPAMPSLKQSHADVLIVEDNPDIRESLVDVLEEEGYRVAVAVNGRDALAQLMGSVRPRLILLDLMMPEMSGWEFRARQQQSPRLSEIPVVVVSGEGNVDHGAKTLDADDYLPKPVDIDHLLNVVERFCR